MPPQGWFRSERDDHVHEPRNEGTEAVVEIIVDVAKALARDQHLNTAEEDEVLAQEGTILAAPAEVGTDEAINVSLEQKLLQGARLVEPKQIIVVDKFELGRQLEVHGEG